MIGRRPPLPGFLALLAALALAAGCSRTPRLIPASADSTAGFSADSTALLARAVQSAWDAPDSGAIAARLTAALVLHDLQVHIASEPRLDWAERTRSLLDSLDVGAETVAGPCAMVVNFFSRSDPSAGSWPWLIACGPKRLGASPMPGQGMALQSVVTRGLFGDPPKPPGPRGVAVLFARRGTAGQQPLLMTLRPRGDGWDLAQTLGADSLGGAGSGSFEAAGDTVELVTRTFSNTPRFEECATCPHIFRIHRFRWRGEGFVRVEDRLVPSPYATFAAFVAALASGDDAAALARVADPSLLDQARQAEWGASRGSWRVAPSTDETAREMIFYRGMKEAWRVRFEPRGPEWVIAGFELTTRSLE
jgi:hypothetical protein